MCGTCCVAPDIRALEKPLGTRCDYLDDNLTCRIYESRPPVCRNYRPDKLCHEVDAPLLEERVQRYLEIFGFEA